VAGLSSSLTRVFSRLPDGGLRTAVSGACLCFILACAMGISGVRPTDRTVECLMGRGWVGGWGYRDWSELSLTRVCSRVLDSTVANLSSLSSRVLRCPRRSRLLQALAAQGD
jgi:hypothetical protein